MNLLTEDDLHRIMFAAFLAGQVRGAKIIAGKAVASEQQDFSVFKLRVHPLIDTAHNRNVEQTNGQHQTRRVPYCVRLLHRVFGSSGTNR